MPEKVFEASVLFVIVSPHHPHNGLSSLFHIPLIPKLYLRAQGFIGNVWQYCHSFFLKCIYNCLGYADVLKVYIQFYIVIRQNTLISIFMGSVKLYQTRLKSNTRVFQNSTIIKQNIAIILSHHIFPKILPIYFLGILPGYIGWSAIVSLVSNYTMWPSHTTI